MLTQAQGNTLFTCAALHLQALSSASSEPAAGAAETHLLRLEGTGPPLQVGKLSGRINALP